MLFLLPLPLFLCFFIRRAMLFSCCTVSASSETSPVPIDASDPIADLAFLQCLQRLIRHRKATSVFVSDSRFSLFSAIYLAVDANPSKIGGNTFRYRRKYSPARNSELSELCLHYIKLYAYFMHLLCVKPLIL